MLIKLLLKIGILRRRANGSIRWPLSFGPAWQWKMLFTNPVWLWKTTRGFYIFRNLPGVIKWQEGRLLPRRWGFGIMGLIEFGDRG